MLKWCNAVRKNQSEALPVFSKKIDSQAQCKKKQFKGHSYQALDSSFREEIDAVAILSFPQQKIEKNSLGANRQISYDNIQSVSTIPDIKHENKQYRAWIKNIKTVLQNIQKPGVKKISDYKDEWETSIESILKNLSTENDHFIEECKKKNEKIRSLEEFLEKIEEENAEMIDAMDVSNQLESEEVIKRYSFSSSTETIVPEETSAKYARRISKESGYSSEESIYSSTETIIPEEPESVFMQTNMQITELEKKNELYKEWINSLDKKLNSNLTLIFIKSSKMDNLKTFKDLKAPSFENVELKQESKKNEEIIQSLEAWLTEAKEDNLALREDSNALQKADLWEDIHQLQFLNWLDLGKEHTHGIQTELEGIEKDINALQEKMARLHPNIETFTLCLKQTKKLVSL